jgi:RimJ/RimL family protein N-acetyltransferase
VNGPAFSEHAMMDQVVLRDVLDEDLDTFFEQQIDPVASRMAAFTCDDPADRDAFDAHWAKIRADETIIIKTILVGDRVAGHVAKFERDGTPEVTYWIGREDWGKGLATRALSDLLREVRVRPIHASAARDNVGSVRVLEKCGFVVTGYKVAFANARSEEIEEAFLVLRP